MRIETAAVRPPTLDLQRKNSGRAIAFSSHFKLPSSCDEAIT